MVSGGRLGLLPLFPAVVGRGIALSQISLSASSQHFLHIQLMTILL